MIKSIVVYSDCGPWGNWQPAIEAEMKRLGIPLTEKQNIAFTILRPLSAKPKPKKIKDVNQNGLFK